MSHHATIEPTYIIYSLRAENENIVMYVGATRETLNRRLKRHISNARRENYPIAIWLRKLESDGRKVIIEELETCHECEWRQLESVWIYHFRRQNPHLLNINNIFPKT